MVNLAVITVAFVLCFGAMFLSKAGGGAYETAAWFFGLASIITMMFAGREVSFGSPRLRRLRAVIMIMAVLVTVVAAVVFFATGRTKQLARVAASVAGGFCVETGTCPARSAPLSRWTSRIAAAGFSDDFRLGAEVLPP